MLGRESATGVPNGRETRSEVRRPLGCQTGLMVERARSVKEVDCLLF
jgi:hypothetical protein